MWKSVFEGKKNRGRSHVQTAEYEKIRAARKEQKLTRGLLKCKLQEELQKKEGQKKEIETIWKSLTQYFNVEEETHKHENIA